MTLRNITSSFALTGALLIGAGAFIGCDDKPKTATDVKNDVKDAAHDAKNDIKDAAHDAKNDIKDAAH